MSGVSLDPLHIGLADPVASAPQSNSIWNNKWIIGLTIVIIIVACIIIGYIFYKNKNNNKNMPAQQQSNTNNTISPPTQHIPSETPPPIQSTAHDMLKSSLSNNNLDNILSAPPPPQLVQPVTVEQVSQPVSQQQFVTEYKEQLLRNAIPLPLHIPSMAQHHTVILSVDSMLDHNDIDTKWDPIDEPLCDPMQSANIHEISDNDVPTIEEVTEDKNNDTDSIIKQTVEHVKKNNISESAKLKGPPKAPRAPRKKSPISAPSPSTADILASLSLPK